MVSFDGGEAIPRIRLQSGVGKLMSCAGSSKNICTVRVKVLLFCVMDLTVYGVNE